jgi:predicted dehydrogenase
LKSLVTMSARKLKVALIGCGQIADAHLQEIGKISTAEVVAVCDNCADVAEQAAARFGVANTFTDLDRMLETVRPDVLHITTPPASHLPIAKKAMSAGAHVYVEKPVTVTASEADELFAASGDHNRLICAGHHHLFDPVWRECRSRQLDGEFGDIVHVESVLGYDLAGPFGSIVSTEPTHWVRKLPGGLFHNTFPQSIYLIAEFLSDEQPEVMASWFTAPGCDVPFPTELRLSLRGKTVTANVLFSCTARPVQNLVRLYGTRRTVEVDLEGWLIRQHRRPVLPGAFARIERPFRYLTDAARALRKNLWRFLRCDLQYFSGMNFLFREFYRAIVENGKPPIPYREVRRVTAIMDTIFEKCRSADEKGVTPSSSANGCHQVVHPEVALCQEPASS